jgi:hypothetical protein
LNPALTPAGSYRVNEELVAVQLHGLLRRADLPNAERTVPCGRFVAWAAILVVSARGRLFGLTARAPGAEPFPGAIRRYSNAGRGLDGKPIRGNRDGWESCDIRQHASLGDR